MTGPEHYQESEKLIAAANQKLAGNDAEWLHPTLRRSELRAEAAIHATLALAAATALPHAGELPVPDHDAWWAAAGSEPVWRDRGEVPL